MATLADFRDERLKKLEALRRLGIDPYPTHTERTIGAGEVEPRFDELADTTQTVVGRIVGLRKFGKLAFIVISDMTGRLQLFIQAGQLEELVPEQSQLGIKQLNLLDTGDFVQATGKVIKTKTGEVSLATTQLRLLVKSLRPMPERQGFTNKEERLRRRYIDMNVNSEVRQRFIRRSKFWQATRDFLNEHGFIEINVPVLEHTTGGADATAFRTHMDALNQDLYLRISHELPLKRLLGAGYERVYDIGPRFRNEGMDDEHLPEHIAMEWYHAYWDWQDGMRFMEKMYRYVIQQTFGKMRFQIGDFDVDLDQDWPVWDYAEVIKKHYDLDVYHTNLDEVKLKLKENQLEVGKADNISRGVDKLWKKVRKTVAGPVWLVNTPKFISPLSKANPDGRSVQRFQPIIAGSELGNGYSELNDPLDQLSRFQEQQQMRDAGDDEAMMLDIDFVEMLEYGMPPACGWGYAERVFWVFEGVTAREGVPFPILRHEIDQVTRKIYPDVKL